MHHVDEHDIFSAKTARKNDPRPIACDRSGKDGLWLATLERLSPRLNLVNRGRHVVR
jgi:hypothetical protein